MAGSFTTDQLDALTEALARGVTNVKYADRQVNYASTADMLLLRDRMIRELSSPRRPTVAYGRYTRGGE